ncbi:MAG TPA: glycerol-3-phosphate acyltransferase [Actinomycetota bacterium]|nr:glycerol-3-phosphate acyltransferase [Actinomycetota bacterium]
MPTIAWIALAYWVGTIPSPYLLARLGRRHDLIAEMRRQDSPGDAHFIVARKMSGVLGGLAIVLDILKGFIPALVARVGGEDPGTLAWIGVAAVAGHSYPPYFRRSGGRGLTTAAGVSLVIVPKAMVGSGVIALAGTVGKLGGFGTSVGFALLPVFAILFGYEATLVLMTVGIVGLIMIRRLEGIEEDRREGVPFRRAILGRWLFDLPRGKRDL